MSSTLAQIDVCAVHINESLVAGDDWQLVATLTDVADSPLQITDPSQVKWTLLDSNHNTALAGTNFTISLGTGPGVVIVTIAAASSTLLKGGTYHDFWRVTLNNITTTVLQGALLVQADPFTAPQAAALKPTSKNPVVRTLQTVERNYGS